MKTLLPFPENRDMVWDYLPELNRPLFRAYYFLLLLSAGGLVALFQYRIPVSLPVSGIVRPALERTEVHSVNGGSIEKMLVNEGDTVQQNRLLFVLKDIAGPVAANINETELFRQQQLVEDLQRLTSARILNSSVLNKLHTPLYRGQAAAYLSKESGETLNWTGARHEADLGRILVKDKVISPKEFYDQQLKEDKMRLTVSALHLNQWAVWQSELLAHRQALAECLNRKTELESRAGQMEIRAPLSGVVAGIRGWYPGCTVRSEQILCAVSPEGELIGECYVPSRSAGLLHPGLPMRIRVDAFNESQFGLLSGKIISVSNDISIIDNKPVFKIRCGFEPTAREGKAAYRGQLKKGLSFQGRCLVTERTLFQLLYDRMEDWFTPGSVITYSV